VNLTQLFSRNLVIGLSIIAVLVVLAVLASFHFAKSLMPDTKKQANLEKLLNLAPPLGWNKDFVTSRDQLKPEFDLLGMHFTQNLLKESTVLGVKILKVSYETGSWNTPSVSIVVGYPLENENDQTLHPSLIAMAAHNGCQIELFPGFVLGQSTIEDAQKLFLKPDKVDTMNYLDQSDTSEKDLSYTLKTEGQKTQITLYSKNGIITSCMLSPR
jgi:hypothetical protein